ncbi:hypothetical protein TL16_g00535 [Triparma laevis f. inornata]|uniref:DUF6824 domain-containing protein n=1 Tax=Triparma laevis f. inornata TaxID=1714386 RepID=A0A9W6ZC57_9STRA|nr:hypothetical protein TL16_g00535 [Triparma laevis f. inornata]
MSTKPFKPAIPVITPSGLQISPNNIPFQITSITHPSQNDILMGRGGGTNNHAGNLNYRKIIEQFKPVYSKSPKNGKLQYSCKVVDIVRSLNPPGRFLKKDAATGLFYDIGEKAARDKTSQCLREGQPELRRAMGLTGANPAPKPAAKKPRSIKKQKETEGDVTTTLTASSTRFESVDPIPYNPSRSAVLDLAFPPQRPIPPAYTPSYTPPLPTPTWGETTGAHPPPIPSRSYVPPTNLKPLYNSYPPRPHNSYTNGVEGRSSFSYEVEKGEGEVEWPDLRKGVTEGTMKILEEDEYEGREKAFNKGMATSINSNLTNFSMDPPVNKIQTSIGVIDCPEPINGKAVNVNDVFKNENEKDVAGGYKRQRSITFRDLGRESSLGDVFGFARGRVDAEGEGGETD